MSKQGSRLLSGRLSSAGKVAAAECHFSQPGVRLHAAPHDQTSRKRVFGLNQDTAAVQSASNGDYEGRFPPDPIYAETAPNARVWRTYEEEAAAFDGAMINQSRDGLDVMLVFVSVSLDSKCGFYAKIRPVFSPPW